MPKQTKKKIKTTDGKENKNDIWGTPLNIFSPIDSIFGFTLDVCANSENAKVKRFFTYEQNSLTKDWDRKKGTANWANIPFSNKNIWFQKAHHEAEHGAVIALLTTMDSLTNKDFQAHRKFVSHIFVFNGRIRFTNTGTNQAFNQGNVLVIYNGDQVANIEGLHQALHEKDGAPLGMLLDYSQFQKVPQSSSNVISINKNRNELRKTESAHIDFKKKENESYADLKVGLAPLVKVLNRGGSLYYRLPNGSVRSVHKSSDKRRITVIDGPHEAPVPNNDGMIVPYRIVKLICELLVQDEIGFLNKVLGK